MDDDLFVVGKLDKNRRLCISQLSKRSIEEADIHNLGLGRGYYIYEVDESVAGGGIQILAKAASLEAAYRLVDIWRLRASELSTL